MAKFTSTEFVDFIINNKEIKEGLLTFGLPLKFQPIKDMFDFYQVFGGEKMVEYPQLFLGIVYQRRDIGVKTTPIFVSTGTSTYKVSYFTKGQLEQMAAMTENQLKLVLEEEATGLKHLIEEEKLLEEKVAVLCDMKIFKTFPSSSLRVLYNMAKHNKSPPPHRDYPQLI